MWRAVQQCEPHVVLFMISTKRENARQTAILRVCFVRDGARKKQYGRLARSFSPFAEQNGHPPPIELRRLLSKPPPPPSKLKNTITNKQNSSTNNVGSSKGYRGKRSRFRSFHALLGRVEWVQGWQTFPSMSLDNYHTLGL